VPKKEYIIIKGKKYEVDPAKKKQIRNNINHLKQAGELMIVPSLKRKILEGKKITNKEVLDEIKKEITKIEKKEKKYENILKKLKGDK